MSESKNVSFGSLIATLRHNGKYEPVMAGSTEVAKVYTFADGATLVVPCGVSTLTLADGTTITKEDHDDNGFPNLATYVAEKAKEPKNAGTSEEPMPELHKDTLSSLKVAFGMMPNSKFLLVMDAKKGRHVPVTSPEEGMTPEYTVTAGSLKKFGKGKQPCWSYDFLK